MKHKEKVWDTKKKKNKEQWKNFVLFILQQINIAILIKPKCFHLLLAERMVITVCLMGLVTVEIPDVLEFVLGPTRILKKWKFTPRS